ncbi:tyrosine--tRNA ligase [Candidatus Vidania fulgoroideorum]
MIYKFGIDTNGLLHLGHIYILFYIKKIMNPKDIIYILLGDYTSTIGDLSGKLKSKKNKDKFKFINDIIRNIKKIFNKKKIFFFKNSQWFNKLKIKSIINISNIINLKYLINRKEIKNRLENKLPIKIKEIMYPIFQSYDNLILSPDYEVGGKDQIFNFCISKKIQKYLNKKSTKIINLDLILGVNSKTKMAKSQRENCIFISELKKSFWKILKISDKNIINYEEKFYNLFKKNSNKFLEKKLKKKHEFYKKKVLFFFNIFSKFKKKSLLLKLIMNCISPKYLSYKLNNKKNLLEFLIENKIFKTKKQIKRLIEQNSLKINGKTIKNKNFIIDKELKIKIGRKLIHVR